MRSLDTNIILRLLLQDNEKQSRAVLDMVEAGGSNDFAVADVVIFEAVWVMQGRWYALERPMIAKLLLRLARIDQINCNSVLIERAIPRFIEHVGVSFTDVCLATYAELNGTLPLLTYDKKLAQALPELVQSVS